MLLVTSISPFAVASLFHFPFPPLHCNYLSLPTTLDTPHSTLHTALPSKLTFVASINVTNPSSIHPFFSIGPSAILSIRLCAYNLTPIDKNNQEQRQSRSIMGALYKSPSALLLWLDEQFEHFQHSTASPHFLLCYFLFTRVLPVVAQFLCSINANQKLREVYPGINIRCCL